WSDVKDFFAGLWDDVVGFFKAAWQNIKKYGDGIAAVIIGLGAVTFSPIIAAIGALALAAYELIKHWDSVAKFFTGLWGDLEKTFKSAATWIAKQLGFMGPNALKDAWG